ncbi:2-polyprenyl-6-methoxyphenol hydroxylase-like FAD-dependent oxidoreductase [Spinactinospora alkalitolerans]|uniref:2-polyprenyl-6-methoxyphenol hydroxylase-like FAD-dependent oxidoreductase n=1 Tax=Spinactinospora alkalitolerans TaxID=687207 RepID=A0A852TQN6_9ACTN|nr:FAD-dependent monooxygenase [Spinactinospora alkalitolerans]NYE45132.1 2-polyprenyl-6-methoxyphenol hydroxylase-like FAD-dependent oxidoreductase [Spinactinospora alkalitolerans]
MKALVCGAGIAGFALAWHLERSGWDVELVERAPAFRTGGYVIDFFGPGLEAADRMGLRPRLEEVRYPFSALSHVDRDGRETSRLEMPDDFVQVVSLLRGDLARTVRDDVRAPVRYGTSVEEVEQTDGGVGVLLTDGTRREVDLLVGADGVHSRIRALVFGAEQRFLRYLGYHVAAYLFTDAGLNRTIGMRYRALSVPGKTAGAYALRDNGVATLLLHREPDPAPPEDPAAALRRRYADLGWVLPELLSHCPQPPELYYDQVTQVEMEQWSRGRVVLLGDACQAVSLFAGHGASMAMAAAWVLADELGEAGAGLSGAGGDLPGALARYQRRMRPAIADTQRFGRKSVRWMAPSSRWRITARDWMMRLAALPGVDRLLLNSITPSGHGIITPRSTRYENLSGE